MKATVDQHRRVYMRLDPTRHVSGPFLAGVEASLIAVFGLTPNRTTIYATPARFLI